MSKRIWLVYLSFVVVYLLITFLIPTEAKDLERYGLTSLQAGLLKLTIAIPIIFIWFAAFYGFDKFKSYSNKITGEPDGHGYNLIANGLGVLAVSLPVNSILSNIINYYGRDPQWPIEAATRFENYLAIILSFAAFWLIFRGSKALIYRLLPVNSQYNSRHNLIVMFTAVLAAFYTHFSLINPNRQFPTGNVDQATFYLSDWLIFLTIVIPYVFVWFIGLQSALNLIKYSREVAGVIYSKLLNQLTWGLVAIIIFTVLLQFFKDFAHLFSGLSLTTLLAVIYTLLIAMAVGYILVASGAKKLHKIEEV